MRAIEHSDMPATRYSLMDPPEVVVSELHFARTTEGMDTHAERAGVFEDGLGDPVLTGRVDPLKNDQ